MLTNKGANRQQDEAVATYTVELRTLVPVHLTNFFVTVKKKHSQTI